MPFRPLWVGDKHLTHAAATCHSTKDLPIFHFVGGVAHVLSSGFFDPWSPPNWSKWKLQIPCPLLYITCWSISQIKTRRDPGVWRSQSNTIVVGSRDRCQQVGDGEDLRGSEKNTSKNTAHSIYPLSPHVLMSATSDCTKYLHAYPHQSAFLMHPKHMIDPCSGWIGNPLNQLHFWLEPANGLKGFLLLSLMHENNGVPRLRDKPSWTRFRGGTGSRKTTNKDQDKQKQENKRIKTRYQESANTSKSYRDMFCSMVETCCVE